MRNCVTPTLDTPPPPQGRRRHWLSCVCAAVYLALTAHASGPRGLPFIRTYPLDEIGQVPRNLRLGFDTFGRVAVMYDGIYAVLNETTWVDRVEPDAENRFRMTTVKSAGETTYYGGRGSWGTVEVTVEGRLRSRPLVPVDAPAWTRVTAFNQILATPAGAYFYDLNGVVYWDPARQRNFFFELPRLTTLFTLANRVFVAAEDRQLREILPASGELRLVHVEGLGGRAIDAAAALDANHAVLALHDGSLALFDGVSVTPWQPPGLILKSGRITVLEHLVGGGVAIAINGQGVFLVQPDGELSWALTLPEFRRVGSMAAGERGVLWVAGENAVHRVFYDSPLTSFGQQLGLSAVWPRIVGWQGRTIVSSNKNLFELHAAGAGTPSRFEPVAGLPSEGVDCIAASGPHFLLGNQTGLYAWDGAEGFSKIIDLENVSGMEFPEPDTCLVIGTREIAAVTFANGRWSEPCARIPGVGDAPILTLAHGAIWIEMGADRIARLTYRNGALNLSRLHLPWAEEQWINAGSLGPTVVLSGRRGQRVYYDDAAEKFCAPPPGVDDVLRRSPEWILRMTQDPSGTIWGTHYQGVVTFTPKGDDYVVDASTFHLPNDSYPVFNLFPDGNMWITTGRSLYHVEQRDLSPPLEPRPILVSLFADELGRDLWLPNSGPLPHLFNYDENSLSFRFFSGTYAWRYPPAYEYRLSASDPWSRMDPNLFLHFPKLRDGMYTLEVRFAGQAGPAAFAFPFTVKPPWYRAPAAYVGYSLLVIAAIGAAARWLNHRSLRRNAVLEQLVQERAKQLEEAMGKLSEESRTTATLAERTRLAAELHDSLQQGLSGSILQLDTTLNQGAISTDVRSRLNIVRKMLSYSREEVQHTVWNLESPLLQNASLGEALAKLAGLLHDGSRIIHLTGDSEPTTLAPATQHNLLRIAQEAITNAVKHANATRIEVSLAVHPATIELTIADDGCGFDATQSANLAGHFGLRGMQARAKSIKAVLAVNSSPGHGTTVKVALPRNETSSHDPDHQNKPT